MFDERRGKPKGYIWFGLCFSWFFGLLLPIEYLALSIALGVAYGTVFQSQTDKEIEVQQEKVDQRNKIEQANHLLDQLAVETTQLIDRVNGYVDPGALEKPQKVLRDVEKYFTA